MIDHGAVQLALRARLLLLEVCTTGSTDLAATATGYSRSAGSFLSDGFRPGMEIVGTGNWAESENEDAKTVTGVTALTMTAPGTQVENEASGRTLSAQLPEGRAWELVEYTPERGTPYIEEEYVPGPEEKITLGPLGQVEALPLYIVRVFVTPGVGVEALRKYSKEILELFAPGTGLTVANHECAVRTNPAPFAGQALPTDSGFAYVPITVPVRVRTANAI